MSSLLKNKGIRISPTTCHKYMNCELKLFSVTRRHKPGLPQRGCSCVIASVNSKNITAVLAIETLSKAITQHPWVLKNGVILHSDQYTSKEFTDYCSAHNLTQSMSRAGCPYDNAPMERYFNTLKSELTYQHSYTSDNKLFSDIDDYVLLWYNSVRPHSFNNGLTPWQKRLA